MFQDFHEPKALRHFSQKITNIIENYYQNPEQEPVIPFRTKQALLEQFRENQPPKGGVGFDRILDYFRDEILNQSVKTWHPLFMNQMFAGASFPSITGDLLASMMNPTLATWEMSPVATIIERNVSEWMAQLIGLPEGSSGIFLPGGSLSNLMALSIARNQRLDPNIKTAGMYGQKPGAILCSAGCHYSIANAAHLLGLGTDHVIKVETNERNEMLIEDFRAKLKSCQEQGLQVFAAVATMGITVTGGFDPLSEIIPICKEHNIHIHVDAAFGGGMCFSEEGKRLLKGIEHVDTVIWDAHKWLHTPLTCTVLLVPNAGVLKHIFNTNANYLFHPQDEDIPEVEDLGKYTILCGKRFDALKVWMLFKALGTEYFARVVEERLNFTQQVYELIEEDPLFTASYTPVSPIVCWQFKAEPEWDQAYMDRMHRWARETCKQRSLALFNITKLRGEDHFRAILINPLTKMHHFEEVLSHLKAMRQEFLEKFPHPAVPSQA